MHVIHTGSNYKWVVIDGRVYIHLEFESIQEARYRMISLALHTYRFNMNGCYLWMYGDEMWKNFELYPSRTKSILNNYHLKIK